MASTTRTTDDSSCGGTFRNGLGWRGLNVGELHATPTRRGDMSTLTLVLTASIGSTSSLRWINRGSPGPQSGHGARLAAMTRLTTRSLSAGFLTLLRFPAT